MPEAWSRVAHQYTDRCVRNPGGWDRLIEVPAMRSMLGDVAGQRTLEAGCGPARGKSHGLGSKTLGSKRGGAAMREYARLWKCDLHMHTPMDVEWREKGTKLGDVTTLADASVVQELKRRYEKQEDG